MKMTIFLDDNWRAILILASCTLGVVSVVEFFLLKDKPPVSPYRYFTEFTIYHASSGRKIYVLSCRAVRC